MKRRDARALTECVINGQKAAAANRHLSYVCSHRGRDANFWLQYGIARISLGDLEKARLWFDNAYEYGKGVPHFESSSTKKNIDNHYSRLLLMEAQDATDADKAFDLVRAALELAKASSEPKSVLSRNADTCSRRCRYGAAAVLVAHRVKPART